jgi:hypothetical protein
LKVPFSTLSISNSPLVIRGTSRLACGSGISTPIVTDFMRPLTTRSELANFSLSDISLQLQADAAEADKAIKTDAAIKAAARNEFIEIPHPRGSILRASMHSMTADLSGLRR